MPDDVALHDLQDVVQVDGAEDATEDQADHGHARGFEPDRPPNLARAAPPTACSTPSSRRRSVIDTVSVLTMPRIATSTAIADLHVHQAEPLIGDSQDVLPEPRRSSARTPALCPRSAR